MPRFSVIVHVHQVQAYLQECLDSVLGQSHDDLEVLAVDDCSSDACGALVDEYAATDRRVVPVHLPAHVGVGPARNVGLARATGDHVVLLNGDDRLAPGALAALAERLRETGHPDVLLHDHARVAWSGGTQRVRNVTPPAGRDTGTFRAADRPAVLGALPTARNAVYRRAFLEDQELSFPPGPHTDVAWTAAVLMTARSVAVLDRVCAHHRERRAPAGAGGGRAVLDLFAQYDRVFSFVEERPALSSWAPVLHHCMLDRFAAVAAGGETLPRRVRAEFFRLARGHHRRHRPVGPGTRSGLRHTLLRLGAHRTHLVLRVARLWGSRAARRMTALARLVRAGVLRLHYRGQLLLPVRADRAVFWTYGTTGTRAAGGHGPYVGNVTAVEAKVRELVPDVRTVWVGRPDHRDTVPTGTRVVRPGTFAHGTALARSRYLVTDGPFEGRPVKRAGQVLLQTHRGTPLGRVGLDLLDRPAAARGADARTLLEGADRWDFALSANRHSTLVRERAQPAAYTTLLCGQPRADVFQRATADDVARLRTSLGLANGTTALLYVPAHRDHRDAQGLPLDLDRVTRRLGARFTLLARFPHEVAGVPLYTPHSRLLDVSDHPSVEELCLASDALVTDYASVMFDYAGLDRPVVLHTEDAAAHEAARGTYFDVREFPPGAVARTADELIDIFVSGHWCGSRSAQLRTAFRDRFCPYDDGHAAERAVRHVFLGQTAGLPVPLPPSERRPAPRPALLPGPSRAAASVDVPHQGVSQERRTRGGRGSGRQPVSPA